MDVHIPWSAPGSVHDHGRTYVRLMRHGAAKVLVEQALGPAGPARPTGARRWRAVVGGGARGRHRGPGALVGVRVRRRRTGPGPRPDGGRRLDGVPGRLSGLHAPVAGPLSKRRRAL